MCAYLDLYFSRCSGCGVPGRVMTVAGKKAEVALSSSQQQPLAELRQQSEEDSLFVITL